MKAVDGNTACLCLRLGNTNTAAVVLRSDDRAAEPVWFDDCPGFIPTAVALTDDGCPVVGWRARRLQMQKPEMVAIGFIADIGCDLASPKRPASPVELATMLIKEVRHAAERMVASQVADCILSVPAWMDLAHRQGLRKAVELAGMNLRMLIPDPVAAVLGAALPLSTRYATVIRMGGSSFEVGILSQHSPWQLDVFDGDSRLGGCDLDRALAERFLDAQQPSVREHMMRGDAASRLRLLQAAEAAKVRLSTIETTEMIVDSGNGLERFELSRNELEDIASPILEPVLESALRSLERARIESSEVGAILLTGGCARIPLLRRLVEERLGETVQIHDPQLVCSRGAALAGICKQTVPDRSSGDEAKSIGLIGDTNEASTDSDGVDGLKIDGSGSGSSVSNASHPESAEHERSKAAVLPRPVTDLVHFSVTSPTVVTCKQTYLMDVWAHLERQRQEVIQRAKEEAAGKEIRIKSRGPVKLARGNVLTVRPRIAGFTIDPPQDTIAWEGEIGNVQFIVSVPGEAVIGDHPGICDFHINGLKIASLRFMVTVGAAASEREWLPVREKRAKRVFASYASEDRDAVLARIHGLLKGVPDLEVFLDVVSLRSGQRWRERLREEVLSRDLLYLFWSQAASESEWVDWEWRCVYDQKGVEFIDPVPLVSPNEVPPPRELADLHFNDWVLAYMNAGGSPGHGSDSRPYETHDKGTT